MEENTQTSEETIRRLAKQGNLTAREIAALALQEADPDGLASAQAKANLLTNWEIFAVKVLREPANPEEEEELEPRKVGFGPKIRKLTQDLRTLYEIAIITMNSGDDADHLIERIGSVQADQMAEWQREDPEMSIADEVLVIEMFLLSLEYSETMKVYAAARGFPIKETYKGLPDDVALRRKRNERVGRDLRGMRIIHRTQPRFG